MIRFMLGLFICALGTGLPDSASLLEIATYELAGVALMLWAMPKLAQIR